MSRRRRSRGRRQVEIFNFSFLDILACTIGLLIFIMVMVFILQAGSPVADVNAISNRKMTDAARQREEAERDNRLADAVESQLDLIRAPAAPDLTPQHNSARAARNEARLRHERAVAELAAARDRDVAAKDEADRARHAIRDRAVAEVDAASQRNQEAREAAARAAQTPPDNRVVFSVHRRSDEEGVTYQVLHIDCRADCAVVLRIGSDGTAAEVGSTAIPDLSDADSLFSRAAREQAAKENPMVLFWVRPDGVAAFQAGMAALPAGLARGYEPAEAGWVFPKGAGR